MTRDFSSSFITGLQADSAEERVHLLELQYSTSVVRISTGSRDIDWNGLTWNAVGGHLVVGQLEESGDGVALDLQLGGIDQSIVSILLSENFRGQPVRLYQAHLDQSAGTVEAELLFPDGLQLDSYQVEENVTRGAPITVTIRTRVMHRLTQDEFRGIRANTMSHQRHFPGDTFFQHVPALTARMANLLWGVPSPHPRTPGSGTGGGRDEERGHEGDTRP